MPAPTHICDVSQVFCAQIAQYRNNNCRHTHTAAETKRVMERWIRSACEKNQGRVGGISVKQNHKNLKRPQLPNLNAMPTNPAHPLTQYDWLDYIRGVGNICMCLVFKFGALDSYALRLENYYMLCNAECKKQSKCTICQNVATLQTYKTNADLKSPALQDLFDIVISTFAFGVLPMQFPHQSKEGAEPHLRPQLLSES